MFWVLRKPAPILVVAPENVDGLQPSTARSMLYAATPEQNLENSLQMKNDSKYLKYL
jgi:hypothetical protein